MDTEVLNHIPKWAWWGVGGVVLVVLIISMLRNRGIGPVAAAGGSAGGGGSVVPVQTGPQSMTNSPTSITTNTSTNTYSPTTITTTTNTSSNTSTYSPVNTYSPTSTITGSTVNAPINTPGPLNITPYPLPYGPVITLPTGTPRNSADVLNSIDLQEQLNSHPGVLVGPQVSVRMSQQQQQQLLTQMRDSLWPNKQAAAQANGQHGLVSYLGGGGSGKAKMV